MQSSSTGRARLDQPEELMEWLIDALIIAFFMALILRNILGGI